MQRHRETLPTTTTVSLGQEFKSLSDAYMQDASVAVVAAHPTFDSLFETLPNDPRKIQFNEDLRDTVKGCLFARSDQMHELLDQYESRQKGAFNVRYNDLFRTTLYAGLRSVMNVTLLEQPSLSEKDKLLLRGIPVREKDVEQFTNQWLIQTLQITNRQTPQTRGGKAAIASEIYGHLCNALPLDGRQKRYIEIKTGNDLEEEKSLVEVDVDEYKRSKLKSTYDAISAGEVIELPGLVRPLSPADLEAINRSAFRGTSVLETRPIVAVKPISTGNISSRAVLTAAGVTGLVVAGTLPAAAAAAPASANVLTTASKAQQIVTALPSTVTQQPTMVVEVMTAPKVQQVVTELPAEAAAKARYQPATVIETGVSTAPIAEALTTPLPSNGQATLASAEKPATVVSLVQPQTNLLGRLGKLTTAAERISALVAINGNTAEVPVELVSADIPKTPGEEAPKPLDAVNEALSETLTQRLEKIEERLNLTGISRAVSPDQVNSTLTMVKLSLENPNLLNDLSKDDLKKLQTTNGSDFDELLEIQAKLNIKLLRNPDFAANKGYTPEGVAALGYAMAQLDLASLQPEELQSRVNDLVQARERKAAEQVAEDRASRDGSENLPRSSSLEEASQKELLDLVRDTADKYNWSKEKSLFMQAAVLEGYPIAPACIVCGAAGNAKVEGAGYQANINEFGNGIGFGLYQWSYERRTELEAAAKTAGVDLSVNNLENYRFQVAYAKKEMKKRDLRDGGNMKEWELFITIKDPGDLADQIRWNFERPRGHDPHGIRSQESESIWKQISRVWSVKQDAKVEAAKKKAAKEAEKFGEIYEKLPAEMKQRIKWINDNVNRDGAHLLEKVEQNETAIEKKYGNGNIPKSKLVLVDNRDHYMSPTAALAFEGYNALFKSIYGRDIEIGGKKSAFRTIAQQEELKRTEGDFAAEPGTSRHGVGKALDLRLHGGDGFDSDEAKFHKKYGPLFGFYTPSGLGPNSSTPEAWHIEFFGDV